MKSNETYIERPKMNTQVFPKMPEVTPALAKRISRQLIEAYPFIEKETYVCHALSFAYNRSYMFPKLEAIDYIEKMLEGNTIVGWANNHGKQITSVTAYRKQWVQYMITELDKLV